MSAEETIWDYAAMEAELRENLRQLEGRMLQRFVVQTVTDEFNVAYLVFADSVVAIQGRVGGEVLQTVSIETMPTKDDLEHVEFAEHLAFAGFHGKVIAQARSVGSAWNGHGVELSFEGVPDKTLIIQSIYAGEKPANQEDCLRLGVGTYSLTVQGGSP